MYTAKHKMGWCRVISTSSHSFIQCVYVNVQKTQRLVPCRIPVFPVRTFECESAEVVTLPTDGATFYRSSESVACWIVPLLDRNKSNMNATRRENRQLHNLIEKSSNSFHLRLLDNFCGFETISSSSV